eukprot:TRINITY_DN6776_c0_g2_i1.p1 TRINITY_DN6776_c0_g2~~TRINITY_DN6776_c0_g2_i1.p1  ORF type:complete len:245 (-),score=-26.61 TRINITY_DN6776_c0_g2_i1:2456-3190(-)
MGARLAIQTTGRTYKLQTIRLSSTRLHFITLIVIELQPCRKNILTFKLLKLEIRVIVMITTCMQFIVAKQFGWVMIQLLQQVKYEFAYLNYFYSFLFQVKYQANLLVGVQVLHTYITRKSCLYVSHGQLPILQLLLNYIDPNYSLKNWSPNESQFCPFLYLCCFIDYHVTVEIKKKSFCVDVYQLCQQLLYYYSYRSICRIFEQFTVDLFARIMQKYQSQCTNFVSWYSYIVDFLKLSNITQNI